MKRYKEKINNSLLGRVKRDIEKKLKVAQKELRQLKNEKDKYAMHYNNIECIRHVEGVIFGFEKVLGMIVSLEVDKEIIAAGKGVVKFFDKSKEIIVEAKKKK